MPEIFGEWVDEHPGRTSYRIGMAFDVTFGIVFATLAGIAGNSHRALFASGAFVLLMLAAFTWRTHLHAEKINREYNDSMRAITNMVNELRGEIDDILRSYEEGDETP